MTDTIPLTDLDQQASADESAEQLELASIHDFGAKLVQPGSREALEHYVRWQVAMRNAEDADAVDLAARGAEIEHHALFPERTNVQFAHLLGENHLRMRVWERGTGITLASGSSSCAVAVAAARRGLTGRQVTLDLDGGQIEVDWRDDGVWMTGPTAHVFDGVLTPALLEGL